MSSKWEFINHRIENTLAKDQLSWSKEQVCQYSAVYGHNGDTNDCKNTGLWSASLGFQLAIYEMKFPEDSSDKIVCNEPDAALKACKGDR